MTDSERTVIDGSATAPLSDAVFSCTTAGFFGFGFGGDAGCGDAGLAVAAGSGVAGGDDAGGAGSGVAAGDDAGPGDGAGGGDVFCAKAIDETEDSRTESTKGTAQ